MHAARRAGPRAVLFDLYETLVTHFDPDWTPPPRTLAARLGLEEGTYRALWSHHGKAWEVGEIATYQEALAAVCHAARQPPDVALLAELTREYEAAYRLPFERMEGAIVELVATLREAGLKLGVVTNASDLDAAPWPGCRLAPLFDTFVASHAVRLCKPDPEIYRLACRHLDVAPAEAIFVGDGGSNELAGAIRAGLPAYWATWFLDRWPPGIRPNAFPGGEWRQRPLGGPPPYPRLASPADLLVALGVA